MYHAPGTDLLSSLSPHSGAQLAVPDVLRPSVLLLLLIVLLRPLLPAREDGGRVRVWGMVRVRGRVRGKMEPVRQGLAMLGDYREPD